MHPKHSSQRDQQIPILLRAAILGDGESLGELCELFRPVIFSRCYRYLQRLRLESYAQDLTQDVILNFIKTFPKITPYSGNLHGLIKKINMHTLYAFAKRNKVMLREVPLPDNDEAEDKKEFRADPLDGVSREVWESDRPSKPPSMSNRYTPRVIGRATREKMKLRAKEKELQPGPGSGNYRRDPRKITAWDMKRINKERKAYATEVEPSMPAEGKLKAADAIEA